MILKGKEFIECEDGILVSNDGEVYRKGTYNNFSYGTRNDKIKEKASKKVLQYTNDGSLIKEWASAKECGRNGYCQSSVTRCCNGERKHHKGYIWAYA